MLDSPGVLVGPGEWGGVVGGRTGEAPGEAGVAEGGALEPRVVVTEALRTLPLSEHPADDTLPRRGLDYVRHVQQLGER